MKSKRGQGHMFWVIIAAALAIIVLVVLVLILTGKTGEVGRTLSQCSIRGGECQPSACSSSQIEITKGCAVSGNNYSESNYCCSKK